MNDTRRDKRAPVSLKVRFKSATLDEFREQYSIDISRGGLFIKSKSPMAVGTLLKFEFQLKDKSRLIHGVGRVVWVRAEEPGDPAPPGMGIKFIKMDPESRALVQEIVDSRGDGPGRFDEGTGDEEPEPAAAAPMFPDLPPAELPPLEDRTAVRHASEFLASALAAGDAGSSAEAEQIAEEGRQRAAARAATEIKLTGSVAEAARNAGMNAPPPPPMPPAEPKARAAEPKAAPEPKAAEPVSTVMKVAKSERPPAPAPAAKSGGSKVGLVVLAALLVGGAIFGLRAAGVFGGSSAPEEAPAAESAAPPAEEAAEPASPTEPVAIADQAEAPPAGEAAPGEEQAAEEAAPAPEPTPVEPPPPPVDVRVESTPRGAEILLGGTVLGQTPATVSLPIGVAATLELRARGYAPETVEVTPAARTPTVRASLTELPYRVHVESTPPGAIARVGSATATTPGTVTLGRSSGNLILRVSLANYITATEVFTRDDFVEADGAMEHSITVTLTRAPASSRPVQAPSAPAPGGESEGGEAPGGSAPAETAPEAAPAPAPEPAPAPAPAPAAPAPAAPAP